MHMYMHTHMYMHMHMCIVVIKPPFGKPIVKKFKTVAFDWKLDLTLFEWSHLMSQWEGISHHVVLSH